MKPLPLVLQRLYPHPATRLAARPWWTIADAHAWRVDGALARIADIEDVDNATPLPKPHFRPGQVWAWHDAVDTHVIVVVEITLITIDTTINGVGEIVDVYPQRPPADAFLLSEPGFTPWSPHASITRETPVEPVAAETAAAEGAAAGAA